MKNWTFSTKEKKQFALFEKEAEKQGFSEKNFAILKQFYSEYRKATFSHFSEEKCLALFSTLFACILRGGSFKPVHKKIRSPFDYYQYGLDFAAPLIDWENSQVLGEENLQKMTEFLEKGENVIFLANHQSEMDPQFIDLMIHEKFPKLASDTFYVAGERVIIDPAAIPFSLGRDLICIYSKKYIDHPPELKEQKQRHNQKTMQKMKELLDKGGTSIYVAPSGGRDRKDKKGEVFPDPFDPQSIELFYLIAKKAKKKTHFFPLALYTYPILPPPDKIQTAIGEERHAAFAPCRLAFGKEITKREFTGENKKEIRKKRADFIWSTVKKEYEKLLS